MELSPRVRQLLCPSLHSLEGKLLLSARQEQKGEDERGREREHFRLVIQLEHGESIRCSSGACLFFQEQRNEPNKGGVMSLIPKAGEDALPQPQIQPAPCTEVRWECGSWSVPHTLGKKV